MPASATLANPRADGSSFLLSFKAGYAIHTSYPVGDEPSETDTYILYRCNSWNHSGHCHCDALSFELFGLGREWLVDSGKLNYEKSADRGYMTSARAHNVVLVDGQDFPFCPIELVDFDRTPEGDYVAVRHNLPEARHVRRLDFHPPHVLRLTDEFGINRRPETYIRPALSRCARSASRDRVADACLSAVPGGSTLLDRSSKVTRANGRLLLGNENHSSKAGIHDDLIRWSLFRSFTSPRQSRFKAANSLPKFRFGYGNALVPRHTLVVGLHLMGGTYYCWCKNSLSHPCLQNYANSC